MMNAEKTGDGGALHTIVEFARAAILSRPPDRSEFWCLLP